MKTLLLALVSVILAKADTIDTSPPDGSVGTFGAGASPLYGWAFAAPAGNNQLDTVRFWLNADSSLLYAASICIFSADACAGGALWTSGSLAGTGSGNLDPVTVSPALGVTPGQMILFYLFASGQGTGRLGVNTAGTDAGGNEFWFQNGTSPQLAWTGGFLDGSPVAAIETFSFQSGGGGGGCRNNCDPPPSVPESPTWAGIITGGALAAFFRRHLRRR